MSTLQSSWGQHLQIYTDGARDPESGKAGFAFVIPKLGVSVSKRLSVGVSVFTTELMAIMWALKWVEEVKPSQVVICSDSASVLMSMEEGKLGARSDLMVELLVLLYKIERAKGDVGFVWVPAHVGVEGNEWADRAAKKALGREIDVEMALGAYECRSVIKKRITAGWQEQWERGKKGRHYFAIQSSVKAGECFLGSDRRQTVTMTRLRMGHCGLAWDLAKMGKHPDGLCSCGKKQTVEHVLMECSRFTDARERMFAEVASEPSSVTLKGLLNPRENQVRTVKAVLEFVAASGLPI